MLSAIIVMSPVADGPPMMSVSEKTSNPKPEPPVPFSVIVPLPVDSMRFAPEERLIPTSEPVPVTMILPDEVVMVDGMPVPALSSISTPRATSRTTRTNR